MNEIINTFLLDKVFIFALGVFLGGSLVGGWIIKFFNKLLDKVEAKFEREVKKYKKQLKEGIRK